MIPKPKHLGPEYAAQFKDRSVVEAYHHRPPYPPETFEILCDLITNEPRVVLDVGCGTGYIARNLIDSVERIDAVDFSQYMIEEGRRLPGGAHPNLNWILGSVEEVPLHPLYALVTAGSSLHWMEWEVVFPRFKETLIPKGYVAIINYIFSPMPWNDDLAKIIPQFSTNQDYKPYDLVKELENRDLFQKHGDKQTAPMLFRQSIDDYIESFHASNGFSRERMSKEIASRFDKEVKDLVSEFCKDGIVELQIIGKVVWGIPKNPLEDKI